MKTAIRTLLVAVMVLGSVTLFAQPQRGQQGQKSPEERAKFMSERLKTELSLSDKQEKQIYQIILENGDKRDEHKKANQATNQKHVDANRKEFLSKMEKALTPEQMKMLKEKHQNFIEGRGARPNGEMHKGQGRGKSAGEGLQSGHEKDGKYNKEAYKNHKKHGKKCKHAKHLKKNAKHDKCDHKGCDHKHKGNK